ncbi:unnamed protein product [Arctogadus glacialis]
MLWLVSIKITFGLKAINLETVRHRELPDSYDFNIMILFNNQAHSGRIKEYTVFCKDRSGENVPCSDGYDFVNSWYILIITSDTLTIIGSILKIAIQAKVLTSYDVCSIFLGLGTMFVWIGFIRYMGYFKKYNASYPYFFPARQVNL